MSLIVFLRGVNVGGNRVFRPSAIARELAEFGVVNVGAAGTFIVRSPGSRAKLRAALREKLPFDAEVFLCEAREILRLETHSPFGNEPAGREIVRFVSILSKPRRAGSPAQVSLPSDREWLLRIIAVRGRFAFGEYRRNMKAIGYLGKIDNLLGVRATTRNWNTIRTLVRLLRQAGARRSASPAPKSSAPARGPDSPTRTRRTALQSSNRSRGGPPRRA